MTDTLRKIETDLEGFIEKNEGASRVYVAPEIWNALVRAMAPPDLPKGWTTRLKILGTPVHVDTQMDLLWKFA